MNRRELLKHLTVIMGGSISSSCSRALVSEEPLHSPVPVKLLDERRTKQIAILAEMIIPQTDTPGDPAFFLKLRELIVLGYFTSEAGATKALTYTPLPGKYDGSYLLEDVGNQWSF